MLYSGSQCGNALACRTTFGVLSALVLVLGGCSSHDSRATLQGGSAGGTTTTRPTARKTLSLDLGGGVKMQLVLIPSGQFLMGSPESDQHRNANEGPQHQVTFARPFYIGTHEVTQGQWRAVMANNPSWHSDLGDDMPVERVSWLDCQEFCRQLSQRTGRTVRLPTEAEWEYACRAGSTTAYSFGDSSSDLSRFAWYEENSPRRANPVHSKQPNAWGLYDMHGNVWEWCQDTRQPSYEGAPADGRAWVVGDGLDLRRVLRGGSWFSDANQCRSAYRLRRPAVMRSAYIGFRVVTELN